MEGKEPREPNFKDGFERLVCQEDLEDEEHENYHQANRINLQVLTFSMERCRTLASVSMMVLAATLLIADIALADQYKKLTDAHLTSADVERIGEEVVKLQGAYHTAVESMKGAQKQLNIERDSQTETIFELDHQTKRSKDYQIQIGQLQWEVSTMRSHLPIISDGCKHCPEGWLFLNSYCYFYPFSARFGLKTWQQAREFCQMYGGDLLVIDSKDKENSTVRFLMKNKNPSSSSDQPFWFGLRGLEGTWKWLNGAVLTEGFWMQGQPNNQNNKEDCAAVTAKTNIFQAWNVANCDSRRKWICEKVSSTQTEPL
uniref:C-type lectin domain-containing protein n=1 Tax=Oryzias sinensis TaxID=183150 RepID=A0A8C7YG46_9TELE